MWLPGSGATFITIRAFRLHGNSAPSAGAAAASAAPSLIPAQARGAGRRRSGLAGSLASPRVGPPHCLQAHEERAEARSESAVAIVGPHMLAKDGQDGEPVGGQGPEE